MRERPLDGSSGEQWYRLVNCHGHSMDVLDVSWSPDESTLASCRYRTSATRKRLNVLL
jgi:hypothetical protein